MKSFKNLISFALFLFLCGNSFSQVDYKKNLLNHAWSNGCDNKQEYFVFIENSLQKVTKKYNDSNGNQITAWDIHKINNFKDRMVELNYYDKNNKLVIEYLYFNSDFTKFSVAVQFIGDRKSIISFKFVENGRDTPEMTKCSSTSPIGLVASTPFQSQNVFDKQASTSPIGLEASTPSNRQDRFDKQAFLKLINQSNTTMAKFCSGKPRTYTSVFEQLSKSLQVNPNSITTNRISLVKKSYFGEVYLSCVAVYYSPKGAHECEVHFDEKGIVSRACYSSPGDMAYTEELIYSFKFMNEFGRTTTPYDQNGNPSGKEWGVGDRFSNKVGR
jgi:hypothetical protein